PQDAPRERARAAPGRIGRGQPVGALRARLARQRRGRRHLDLLGQVVRRVEVGPAAASRDQLPLRPRVARVVVKVAGDHQLKLMISGDLHHYARYTGPERELITAGGGGAYLYPTHDLPEEIEVPPPASLARKASPKRTYRLASTYPSRSRSRALSWGVLW